MGFQIVEATYKDKHQDQALVLNASLIEPVKNDLGFLLKQFSETSPELLEKQASSSSDIIDVNLISMPSMFKSAEFANLFLQRKLIFQLH